MNGSLSFKEHVLRVIAPCNVFLTKKPHQICPFTMWVCSGLKMAMSQTSGHTLVINNDTDGTIKYSRLGIAKNCQTSH